MELEGGIRAARLYAAAQPMILEAPSEVAPSAELRRRLEQTACPLLRSHSLASRSYHMAVPAPLTMISSRKVEMQITSNEVD